MNILVVEDCASSQKGGAERSMRKWCEYVAEKQSPVYFIYEKYGDFLSEEKKDIYCHPEQINLQPIGNQGIIGWIKSVFKLYEYCKKNKIDLIFTHIIHAFPLFRIVKLLYPLEIVVYFKWVYSKPQLSRLTLWGLSGVDNAFANSQYVADYWKKQGVTFSKTQEVIPNGIPPSNLNKNFAFPLSKEEQSFNLLFAGRIYPEKGLHLLLKALHRLNLPGWKLLIAGYFSTSEDHEFKNYHIQIEDLINKLEIQNNIIFLGFTNDLRAYMHSMDLVVVPSIGEEAQSIVLMEAMAESTLVIGSRVGGIPERLSGILSDLLFEPTIASLMEKIQQIFNMPHEKVKYYQTALLEEFNQKYHIQKTIHSVNWQLDIDI